MATADHAHAATAVGAPMKESRGSRLSIGLLGMVIFIGSELMLFGSLFTAYFMVRFNIAENNWPPVGSNGEPFEVPVLLTGVNTLILVGSSFTVWWAEHCMKHGDRKGFRRGLLVTILMGGTFLLIQINEYIHLGFTPQDQAFGSAFYTLTGFHGAHVLIGLTLLTFCYVRARAGDFDKDNYAPLAASSIYWHFVDVVWILLFVLVYLI